MSIMRMQTKRQILNWAFLGLAMALLMAPTLRADGEFVATEETGAVERAFEGKVHEILDGVIKPDRFAVYVQVKMKADAKALQEYYEEKTLTTLPGMSIPDPELAHPANNKLYSLVQSRKVIVVLDKSVTGEQELLTKEILKAKLSMDERKGDSLDIRRAEVPTVADRAIASVPQESVKTESWIKYFMFGLAATFLAAVGVLLWQLSLLRERVNSRAKVSADIQLEPQQKLGGSSSSASVDGEQGEPTLERSIVESDPISAVELKEKILALAVSQPRACSHVARKLISTREGMRKLAVACEAIGFEYAKQLFDAVSPGKWRAMGEYLRSNLSELSRTPVGPVLLEIYTDMLAESMGADPGQTGEGPFDFIHKISDQELVKLFQNEDPAHIAFIAAFWEAEEMSRIFSVLTDARRKETILHIARLKSLPGEVVHQAAMRFAERLRNLRARHEVDVDGSEVVARMLDSVDTTTEEELLKFIEREDPATRDRLRTHYFSFDSVHMVPQEVLMEVLGSTDSSVITHALVGADNQVIQAVLSVLPPKQRAIVEDDVRVAMVQGSVPRSETGTARKQLVVALRKSLKDRGIELHQLGVGTGPAINEAPTMRSPALASMAVAQPIGGLSALASPEATEHVEIKIDTDEAA